MSLKERKLQEDKSRDQYETERVQRRQMEDWQRAEQVAAQRKQMMINIATENRQLAEIKRQNEMAARVHYNTREETNVKNFFYKLQSSTVRWKSGRLYVVISLCKVMISHLLLLLNLYQKIMSA